MTQPKQPDKSAEAGTPDPPAQLLLESSDLFRGRQEVWIRHDGVLYRLRITRRRKLILQK